MESGQVVGCIAVCETFHGNNTNNKDGAKDNEENELVFELRRLVVDPLFLRKGIATKLVETVKSYAKEHVRTSTSSSTSIPSSSVGSNTAHITLNDTKTETGNILLKLTCLDGQFVSSSNPACELYTRCGFKQRPSSETNPTVPMCEFTIHF